MRLCDILRGRLRVRTALVMLAPALVLGLPDARSAVPASARKVPASKTKAPVEAETNSVEALTAAARPSVVVITHHGRDGREDGVGAGFVIGADGLIATALHVIGEARPISVRLPNGQRREVIEIFAWDRNLDLAIIRIDARGLPALRLGNSDTLKQGAPVIALGNPHGLEHSVVQGVVSARRDFDGVEMIQLAIPVEPGNSGGPLLDLKGRVQGVLTMKSAVTANLGFAVPSKPLQALLDHPNSVPLRRWLTFGALSPKKWTPVFGARWRQKGGRIEVDGAGEGFGGRSLCLARPEPPAPPYELSVSVRLDDESGAAGLVFGSDGGDRHWGFYPSAGQLRLTRFDGPNVFSWTILRQVPSEHYQPGEWNELRVRVAEDKVRCYVNGQFVTEAEAEAFAGAQAGLAKFRETKAQFKGFQLGTNLAAAPSAPGALPPELARRVAALDRAPDAELAEALRPHAPGGFGALHERARQLDREAARLRHAAGTLHRQSVQAALVKALEGPEEKVDLFGAALLVAKLDNPDLDVDAYHGHLGDLTRELQETLPPEADDATRLGALRKFLFTEQGFHGSRTDYYNRANSYMNDVLDDREGLPITLSVLFLELAGRIGLPGVSGLPLPGHFMVRYTPRRGESQIIDVFDGGRLLTRSEAQERVLAATGEGFRDAEFRAATKREIILRILRNLLGHLGSGERAALSDSLRYLDTILALAPDSVGDRLNHARLRLQKQDNAGAKEDFQWLLDHQPAGVDLERLAELLRSL